MIWLLVGFIAFTSTAYFFSPWEALACAVLAGALSELIKQRLPSLQKKLREGKVEKELPAALRLIAAQIAMGMPFIESLESISKGYGELSRQMIIVLREINNGASAQKAIAQWGRGFDSVQVRKSASVLIQCYESGEATPLKELARELFATQKALSRQYSSKLVFYSMMFIAVSAIVPALFQAFVMVGSSFMDIGINATQALLIPVLGFPLASIGVMAFIWLRRPACI